MIDRQIQRAQNRIAAAIRRLPPTVFAAAFGVTLAQTISGIGRLHTITAAAMLNQAFAATEVFVFGVIGASVVALAIDSYRRCRSSRKAIRAS
jgi:hypothetical protein